MSSPVLSGQEIIGEFTTVSESDCNSEIHFYSNGKGVFLDYCYTNKPYTSPIFWHIVNSKITVNINGIDEVFKYNENMSCHYFGEEGSSAGLTGFDLYFWKKTIQCK